MKDKRKILFGFSIIFSIAITVVVVTIGLCSSHYRGLTPEAKKLAVSYETIAKPVFEKEIFKNYKDAKIVEIYAARYLAANDESIDSVFFKKSKAVNYVSPVVIAEVKIDDDTIFYAYDTITEKMYSSEYYDEIINSLESSFFKRTKLSDEAAENKFIINCDIRDNLLVDADFQQEVTLNGNHFLPLGIKTIDDFKKSLSENANKYSFIVTLKYPETNIDYSAFDYETFLKNFPVDTSILFRDINNKEAASVLYDNKTHDITISTSQLGHGIYDDLEYTYNKDMYSVNVSEVSNLDKKEIKKDDSTYRPEEKYYSITVISDDAKRTNSNSKNSLGGTTTLKRENSDVLVMTIPEKYKNSATKLYAYVVDNGDLVQVTNDTDCINIKLTDKKMTKITLVFYSAFAKPTPGEISK